MQRDSGTVTGRDIEHGHNRKRNRRDSLRRGYVRERSLNDLVCHLEGAERSIVTPNGRTREPEALIACLAFTVECSAALSQRNNVVH